MGWNRSKGTIILYYPIIGLYTKQDKGLHRFPYAVWSLVPRLIEAGYSVQVFDGRVDDKNAFLKAVGASERPLFVGISSLTGTQLIDAMKTAKQVRAINKEIPIVWGGWHVTLNPFESIKEDLVDVIVRGRGEDSILTVANALLHKENINMIESLPLSETFPKIPFELTNITKYGPYFGYLTSTGCAWHCAFCAIQQVYKGKMFFKPMDQVINELKYIVDNYRGLTQLNIDDDLFFINKERVIEFCERWNNYGHIPMSVLAHVNVLSKYDDTMWMKVLKAGFHSILIGAESGNQNILNKLKKHQTPDKILRFVETTAKYGFTPDLSCMTGFPRTTIEDDFKDTILMLQKAGTINPRTTFKLFFVKPFAGTELFNEFKNMGYKMPETMMEWADYNLRSVPPWCSHEIEDAVNFFVYHFVPKIGWNYTWDSFMKAFEEARSNGPIHHLGGF